MTTIKNNEEIGAEEFSHLLDGFAPLSDKIALAVSGGPDSMALAYCVKRWAGRPCLALIVDHGLRAESAGEAVQVKERLSSLGITAEILRWEHEPVNGRLHEKARTARYRLLLDACRRYGAADLLLAHHSGDQAETILMRLAKGSGIDGLAGIAAQTTREDIRLLRPFLSLCKERLVATCEARGIAYVVDPSNASGLYARGRLRKIMPLLADEGMTVESLVTLGARAREAADALQHTTQEFLKSAAQSEIGGSVRLDRAALREVPRAIALRALAACLRYVHEGEYPPEYEVLSALLELGMGTAVEEARTLYGCIASVAENRICFLREPAAATEILPLAKGGVVLWDKRWLVTAKSGAESAVIRALGSQTHEVIDSLAPGLRHLVPQGRVRATLPALWQGEKITAIPSFKEDAPFHMAYKKQGFP